MDKTKLEYLKAAGRQAAIVHQLIADAIAPGVNTLELEAIAKDAIQAAGMKPAFLGYKGYPAVTCISVNDEIVHGIPKSLILQEGDVVSIDLGVSDGGWIVDTARTHPVGVIDPRLQKLLATAQEALDQAIAICRIGQTIGDIGATVQQVTDQNGFFVVRDLTGHGVGRTLQEPPTIPNHGTFGAGQKLKADMVLAIEPIITDKPTKIGIGQDGWTIMSDNGAIATHVEDTIIITENEPVVLTRLR